jgi:hypothetical protein
LGRKEPKKDTASVREPWILGLSSLLLAGRPEMPQVAVSFPWLRSEVR